jgi:hypothetical protein
LRPCPQSRSQDSAKGRSIKSPLQDPSCNSCMVLASSDLCVALLTSSHCCLPFDLVLNACRSLLGIAWPVLRPASHTRQLSAAAIRYSRVLEYSESGTYVGLLRLLVLSLQFLPRREHASVVRAPDEPAATRIAPVQQDRPLTTASSFSAYVYRIAGFPPHSYV